MTMVAETVQQAAELLKTNDKVRIPTTEFGDNTHVELSLGYNLGGINYATGRNERRGYYLHVTPIKVEERNGYSSVRTILFGGTKMFMSPQEISRKSKKQRDIASIAATEEIIQSLVDYIKS